MSVTNHSCDLDQMFWKDIGHFSCHCCHSEKLPWVQVQDLCCCWSPASTGMNLRWSSGCCYHLCEMNRYTVSQCFNHMLRQSRKLHHTVHQPSILVKRETYLFEPLLLLLMIILYIQNASHFWASYFIQRLPRLKVMK